MLKGASAAELQKFRVLQQQWYNPNGPLRTLHAFNPIRVKYINDTVKKFGRYAPAATAKTATSKDGAEGKTEGNLDYFLHKNNAGDSAFSGNNIRILDVGCGGGILSESLYRLGAMDVTGIDLVEESIAVANLRKEQLLSIAAAQGATVGEAAPAQKLNFRVVSLFDVLEEEQKKTADENPFFDVVIATEVVEHVDDARGFLKALCDITNPKGGLLIVSTMEKSAATYLSHILVAESLTGMVQPGTHDWGKFINKNDLSKYCNSVGKVREAESAYVLALPSLFESMATRSPQVCFKLTNNVNTGHYFWTGLKTA